MNNFVESSKNWAWMQIWKMILLNHQIITLRIRSVFIIVDRSSFQANLNQSDLLNHSLKSVFQMKDWFKVNSNWISDWITIMNTTFNNEQCCTNLSFDSLASLSILHNYFDGLTKFSDLYIAKFINILYIYRAKFLNIWTKLFFSCR